MRPVIKIIENNYANLSSQFQSQNQLKPSGIINNTMGARAGSSNLTNRKHQKENNNSFMSASNTG